MVRKSAEPTTPDPRPVLSIAFVTWEDRGSLPGVLESAPGAHHRYKVLREMDSGFDRTDLTLLWVPMVPDPLQWIGVVSSRECARADGNVLVVLTKTRGYPAHELDTIEREIRERLSELGGNADEYRVVHETRLPQRRDGTPGSSSVIEAINAFARVQNTGVDGPFLATTTRSAVSSTGRSTMVHVSVDLGTAHEGDSLHLYGRQVAFPRARARANVGDSLLPVAVQSLFRTDPEGVLRPEPVRELVRFELGKISLSNLSVDAIGALLVPAHLPMATAVRLRVSWPWSPERGVEAYVPGVGELMPTYLPVLGSPMPATARKVEVERDGLVVEVAWPVVQPIFPGTWTIVDHATPRVYTASLIEIVDV